MTHLELNLHKKLPKAIHRKDFNSLVISNQNQISQSNLIEGQTFSQPKYSRTKLLAAIKAEKLTEALGISEELAGFALANFLASKEVGNA